MQRRDRQEVGRQRGAYARGPSGAARLAAPRAFIASLKPYTAHGPPAIALPITMKSARVPRRAHARPAAADGVRLVEHQSAVRRWRGLPARENPAAAAPAAVRQRRLGQVAGHVRRDASALHRAMSLKERPPCRARRSCTAEQAGAREACAAARPCRPGVSWPCRGSSRRTPAPWAAGDRARPAQHEAVRVAGAERDLPARQAKVVADAADLGRERGRQHRGEATRGLPGDRASPPAPGCGEHRAGVAQAEVEVLVAVGAVQAIALRALDVQRRPAWASRIQCRARRRGSAAHPRSRASRCAHAWREARRLALSSAAAVGQGLVDRLLSSPASVQQDADMTDHASPFSNNAFLKAPAGECGHALRRRHRLGRLGHQPPRRTLRPPRTIREASHMLCDAIHPHFDVSPEGRLGDAGDLRAQHQPCLPCAEAMAPGRNASSARTTWRGWAATTASPCPCCGAYRAWLGRRWR